MACGLFGKMPSKRDFISYNMTHPFLGTWETWLQTGVAASREALGEGWKQSFLAAPIWRFWLGAEIAGTSVAGALMPSVDQVGRYFPLSLCASAVDGARIPPPPDSGLDEWLSGVERFLLELLEDDLPEDSATLIGAMTMPPTMSNPRFSSPPSERLYESPHDGDIGKVFAALESEDHALVHGERSYWWTFGGPQHPPQVLVQIGLPEPGDFALLIGGSHPMSLAS